MTYPQVTLSTNFGDITLELFPDSAPKAVENFLGLVEKGYYDGIIFHRIIANFMIQGGDPSGTGRGGKSIWFRHFQNEIDPNLTHGRGILAMANAGKDTNGSQFYIVTTDESWIKQLDGDYTIFGRVANGMDVVDEIERVPTDRDDRPKISVVIEKASLQ